MAHWSADDSASAGPCDSRPHGTPASLSPKTRIPFGPPANAAQCATESARESARAKPAFRLAQALLKVLRPYLREAISESLLGRHDPWNTEMKVSVGEECDILPTGFKILESSTPR